MADEQVAAEGTYAFDEAGLRRWIAPGDDVPPGWTREGGESEEKAPVKVRPKAKAKEEA